MNKELLNFSPPNRVILKLSSIEYETVSQNISYFSNSDSDLIKLLIDGEGTIILEKEDDSLRSRVSSLQKKCHQYAQELEQKAYPQSPTAIMLYEGYSQIKEVLTETFPIVQHPINITRNYLHQKKKSLAKTLGL